MSSSISLAMLSLPSTPEAVARVEPFVQRAAQQYRIGADLYGNILISLTEAVNNAMIHGNGRDARKAVRIHLRHLSNRLAIRVSDEGNGFDYRQIPDPTAPENLTKIGGRGVFLMHQLCDQVSFYDNGSTVEMQFLL